MSDINVKFGGDVGGLKSASQEAAAAVKASTASIHSDLKGISTEAESSIASLTNTVKGAVAPILAMFGALAGAGKVVEVTRQFDKINASLITATGSSEKAQVAFGALEEFAAKTPYSLEEVSNGFIKLVNMGLNPSERALTSYGNTAASMGKSLNQMIEAVADAATGEFERLKEFGIKAKQEGDKVIFTFRGVKTEVNKNAKEIEDYLIKLGENEFAGAMANRMDTLDGAMSNLGDSWDKLFRTISGQGIGELIESMVRAATAALDWLSEKIVQIKSLWASAMTTFKEAYAAGMDVAGSDEVVSRADQLRSAIQQAEQSIKRMSDVEGGPSEGAIDRIAAMTKGLQSMRAELAVIEKVQAGTYVAPTISAPEKQPDRLAQFNLSKGDSGFGQDKKKGAGSDTRLSEWRNELEQMKEAEGNFFRSSLADEERYWTSKLAQVKGNGAKDQALRRQIEHEIFQIKKQMADQGRQLEEEEMSAKRAKGLDEVAFEREVISIKKQLGEVSAQEEIIALKLLADKEYQIELAALQQKLELYKEDALAKASTLHEIEQLERRHNLTMQKLNGQMLVNQQQTVKQWLQPIQSAISTSIQGMIQGTLTLGSAMRNLMRSILASFIDFLTKLALEWAAERIANMLGITTAVAGKKTEVMATVPANAAIAASGAAASVASIPVIGPELAAAAYSSTMGLVMSGLGVGMMGFAVGSWNVPGDMFTKIHKGEMIVPEQFAQGIRDGGGIGGGGAIHLHVNAVDGDSVRRMFRNNAPAIAEVLRRHARNFTPMRT